MRNTNKKGFTIVELVIVVAVIAILAAVLIPTFSSIIKKANQSADQQAVTNMNKLLATEAKAEDVDGVIEILIKNSYAGDLTTYFAGYSLAWVKSENAIVLVENDAIVYPANLAGKELAYEVIKPMATDGEALAGGLEDGKTVYVGDNVTVDGLAPEAAGDYIVKLNGNTLNASDLVGAWVADAKIVVSNGVIDGSSIEDDDVVVYASRGGSVELNNVQVYAPAGYNPIQCYGGTMILNNVTTSQSGEAHASWYNSAIQVINTIKQVEQPDGSMKWTIYGEQANLTVNGGMYTGDKAIQISAPGGNVTIEGGTFTGTTYVIQDDFAPQNYAVEDATKTYESVITINGGNLNGNIKISKATVLVINGGTFSGTNLTYFDTTANKTVTVALTAENLAQFVTAGSTIVVNGVSYTK